MFKRKTREPLASEATDNIHPWEMLDEAGIAAQTARLRDVRPGRNLVAFARRLDPDAVAGFDKGPDGTGKAVVVVEGVDAGERASETAYPGFGAWFDAALADAGL